ncbi:COP9 SIGNALOSOME COMPLEX SUBUNIT 3-LIKE ISOFORM X1 [Salix koriyanagi]|uniref:COP9 SIGNALOSOME COMPLEX SUBUNIT 3-LIKE ISOFORM X1 n=1 Tax=Salix koriyanagi TaxID=2511006 RepID=A0A9Q0UNM4_9ROSI|nr:COP9 SIGNALOSOME COMPLEX SUBUNIT 3-LIKE ISOFORM X1 [Salix koriyanagi]
MATAESCNVVDLSLLSTRFKKADEELHNESTRLLAFLEQLDPTLHSLGYLYIFCNIQKIYFWFLSFKIGCSPAASLSTLLQQLREILKTLCQPYMQLAKEPGQACTSRPVTNEQARRLVLNLSRFLTCCVADQIRLTSEKGMICIGQKYFQKALELLHNAVTTPMPSINTISVEAFKKYIFGFSHSK